MPPTPICFGLVRFIRSWFCSYAPVLSPHAHFTPTHPHNPLHLTTVFPSLFFSSPLQLFRFHSYFTRCKHPPLFFFFCMLSKVARTGRSAIGRRWPQPCLGTGALRFWVDPAGSVNAGKGQLALPVLSVRYPFLWLTREPY